MTTKGTTNAKTRVARPRKAAVGASKGPAGNQSKSRVSRSTAKVRIARKPGSRKASDAGRRTNDTITRSRAGAAKTVPRRREIGATSSPSGTSTVKRLKRATLNGKSVMVLSTEPKINPDNYQPIKLKKVPKTVPLSPTILDEAHVDFDDTWTLQEKLVFWASVAGLLALAFAAGAVLS